MATLFSKGEIWPFSPSNHDDLEIWVVLHPRYKILALLYINVNWSFEPGRSLPNVFSLGSKLKGCCEANSAYRRLLLLYCKWVFISRRTLECKNFNFWGRVLAFPWHTRCIWMACETQWYKISNLSQKFKLQKLQFLSKNSLKHQHLCFQKF